MMNNLAFNEIGDKGIIFLHRFPTLKQLHLWSTRITGEGVKTLSEGEFPHLQSLNLSKKVDISGLNRIGDEALEHLHKFATLQKLYLR